jgi:hypothetical protein
MPHYSDEAGTALCRTVREGYGCTVESMQQKGIRLLDERDKWKSGYADFLNRLNDTLSVEGTPHRTMGLQNEVRELQRR